MELSSEALEKGPFSQQEPALLLLRRAALNAKLPMTTADPMLFGSAEDYASQQSLRGLDWLNFFLAGVLTGFGPFVALYLRGLGWTQVEIGSVLTISGLAGLLIQIPGGNCSTWSGQSGHWSRLG